MLHRGTREALADASDFVHILQLRAETAPHGVAFTMGEKAGEEKPTTYAELDASARRIAAALVDAGLDGERALLLLQPGADYVASLFGCWYAGVTAVPLYAPRQNQSMERIRLVAADAGARVVLSTSKVLGSMQELPVPWAACMAVDALDRALGERWVRPVIDGDTLAVLQYTSGSTGRPKGVRLCQRNLTENSRIISSAMRSGPNSVGVIWLPAHHDMGLIGGLLQPVYTGFPVHLMSPATFLQRPMRWLEAISHHRGTVSAAPNFAYASCVQRARPEVIETLDLSSWRVAGNGAEPIHAATMRRFAQMFAPAGFDARAFFPCFGLAEATLMVTSAKYFEGARVEGVDRAALSAGCLAVAEEESAGLELVSCGAPATGVAVQIVEPGTSRPLPPGCVGEVWVAGRTIADGYWHRPEETEQTFNGVIDGRSERWLRTGDLGVMHDGEMFVTGRVKDLIVIRGHNHYPSDIENTVMGAHETLKPRNAAAFSISLEDGEGLGLVIEAERSWRSQDIEAVRTAVVAAVSHEHRLQVASLAFVPPNGIPKTSSGKVQRSLTRDYLVQGRLSPLEAERLSD